MNPKDPNTFATSPDMQQAWASRELLSRIGTIERNGYRGGGSGGGGGGGADTGWTSTNGGAVPAAPAAGAWQLLPLPTTWTKRGDAAAFVRNADGTLTIRDAGIYVMEAYLSFFPLAGTRRIARLYIGADTTGAVLAGDERDATAVATNPGVTLPFVGYFAAGAVVSVQSYSSEAGVQRSVVTFGIARIGGAGATGAQGPATLETYIGTAAPVPRGDYTVWIDTDEPQPAWVPPTLVSALPSAPFEGQEVYFQNAAMALQGCVWHLRFRDTMGLTFMQWEFLGGAPLEAEAAATVNTSSATFVDLGGATPQLTMPIAGDYDVMISSAIWSGATQGAYGVVVPAIVGGSAPVDNDGAIFQNHSAYAATGYIEKTARRNIPVAGAVLKHQYRSSAPGNQANFGLRMLSARPVRLSG